MSMNFIIIIIISLLYMCLLIYYLIILYPNKLKNKNRLYHTILNNIVKETYKRNGLLYVIRLRYCLNRTYNVVRLG